MAPDKFKKEYKKVSALIFLSCNKKYASKIKKSPEMPIIL
jgi:hypothetical protein